MGNVLKMCPTTLCNSQKDIVDNVHIFAETIQDGEWGDIRTLVAVVETTDGKLTHLTIGLPCDLARAVGVMQMEVIRSTMDTN